MFLNQSWPKHTHVNIERGWTERDYSKIATMRLRLSHKTLGRIRRNFIGWHTFVLVLSLLLGGVAFATVR